MNDILSKQNNAHFLELLKAQRIAYSQCKSFQIFDIVSLLIAILFPLLALKFPNSQNVINAFGVLWTIAYLITEGYRKNKTAQGAVIQEQFDTELYELDWNEILCKDKVNIDTIQVLSKKYKDNDLSNWYSTKIDPNLPKQIAVILCQRINFSWEITQRKSFVIFLTLLVSIYYLVYVVVGFQNNIGFFDLLVLLSPSISFLVYCVLNILSLRTHIKSKNETLKFIDNKLEEYRQNRSLPTSETLRQIQDVIFTERAVPEKIPDWYYRLKKDTNENFIDNLIVKIQNTF
jgi:hypothetical protein